MDPYSEFQLLGKTVVAALLGGVISLEREVARKPAGLRTHMLVGTASALLVTLAPRVTVLFEQTDLISTDPIRIVQAIIIGISFLGAGTILKYNHEGERHVEGLATSASIFLVAAIGITVALDAYILALGVTVLSVLINWGLALLVNRGNS